MNSILRLLMSGLILVALSALPVLAQAADEPTDDPDAVSSLSNPAQAAKAEGLAAAATEKAEANLAEAEANLEAADAAINRTLPMNLRRPTKRLLKPIAMHLQRRKWT